MEILEEGVWLHIAKTWYLINIELQIGLYAISCLCTKVHGQSLRGVDLFWIINGLWEGFMDMVICIDPAMAKIVGTRFISVMESTSVLHDGLKMWLALP